jgi:DUF4097 and DUF4098 domain-containing protein YvlB
MKNNRLSWFRDSLFVIGIGLISVELGCALPAQEKEETTRTYPLSAQGQISIHNVNGGIDISVWDRTEVQLQVTKTAKKQADLDAVEIEIDADPDRLQIRTKYPEEKGWKLKKGNSTQVFYKLSVPKHARLEDIADVNGSVDIRGVEGKVRASTVNGALKATGLVTQASLSTVNGSLTAEFQRLDDGDVTLDSVNGGVHLSLPQEANAALSLTTVNGGIHGNLPTDAGRKGKNLKTTLGTGTAKVRTSTVNGGIQLSLMKPSS